MKNNIVSNKKNLIFVVGSAGTGKTTIAEQLVQNTNCVYLDKDTVGGRYSDLIMQMNGQDINDRDSKFYQQHCRDMEYIVTMDVALDNLALGRNVLIVGPFGKELLDEMWIEKQLARIESDFSDVRVTVVHVYLSDMEQQRKRIVARNHPRDAWKLANWEEFSVRIKGLKDFRCEWNPIEVGILHLDNSGDSIKENVQKAMDYLEFTPTQMEEIEDYNQVYQS